MNASKTHPPRLMLVTDRRRTARSLPDLVADAVSGGVDAVQVREPGLSSEALRRLVLEIQDVVAGRATVLVNGNLGVAGDLGTGVHLPELGPATAEARRVVGSGLLGRSVHSPDAARAAAGADYLLAGHVFATASKPDRAPIGLAGLRRIVEASWAPVLAVGGITPGRVAEVVAAGAEGIAVIGAIAEAADPRAAAAALRGALDASLEGQDTMQHVEAGPVRIVVNGKEVEVEPETTVTDYLADKGLTEKMAVVELNGAVLARRAYDSTFLAAGDRVEIVHAVGGG